MRRLLVNFAAVGDLVMATPLMRVLGEGAELHVLARPYAKPLLSGSQQPFIQRVHPLLHPNRGRKGLARLLLGGHRRALGKILAEVGYDEVYLYEVERPVIRDWIRDFLPKAEVKILGSRPDHDPWHCCDVNPHALRRLGMLPEGFDPLPRLDIHPDLDRRAQEILMPLGKRVIGVQAGSQRTHRSVGFSRLRPNLKGLSTPQWAGLLTAVLESGDADAIAFHGVDRERDLALAIRDALPERLRGKVHDLCGKAKLDVLPAVLARQAAMISVDTGPAHAAAAVGCPLLVFFGPSDPTRFTPRGSGAVEVVCGKAPCQFCMDTDRYKSCRDNICLNQISVDDLTAAWRRLQFRVGAASAAG